MENNIEERVVDFCLYIQLSGILGGFEGVRNTNSLNYLRVEVARLEESVDWKTQEEFLTWTNTLSNGDLVRVWNSTAIDGLLDHLSYRVLDIMYERGI